ncbi:MAG: ABC transporter permease [Egibacteraceae bacterium]
MTTIEQAPVQSGRQGLRGELAKLAAFGRRDLLVAWSYRLSFVADLVALFGQAVMFGFISKLVDPSVMPDYGGRPTSFVAFVIVGLTVGVFVHLGWNKIVAAIRNEQLMGTLESMFLTPTRTMTIQLGLVIYDLVYIPLRTVVFLAVVSAVFGVAFDLSGLGPAVAVLMGFIPWVWGVGIASAAGVVTFRRGANLIGFSAMFLNLGSGVFFPLELLPGWARALARVNPIAIATESIRQALLGGAGWAQAWSALALLVPMSSAALVVGAWAFNLALRRERRLGTLGQY